MWLQPGKTEHCLLLIAVTGSWIGTDFNVEQGESGPGTLLKNTFMTFCVVDFGVGRMWTRSMSILLRQAWDLGPSLQCLHLDTLLLEHKIQRNYMGLKMAVCMCSWNKSWTKRYKKTNNSVAISEELGAKELGVGSKNRVLCMSPCTQHHKGVGRPPKPPLRPTSRHSPTLTHLRNEHTPHQRVSKGTC